MPSDLDPRILEKWLKKEKISVYEATMLTHGYDPYCFDGIEDALDSVDSEERRRIKATFKHLLEDHQFVIRSWQLNFDPNDRNLIEEQMQINVNNLSIDMEDDQNMAESAQSLKHHKNVTYHEIINGLIKIIEDYHADHGKLKKYSQYSFIGSSEQVFGKRLMELLNDRIIPVSTTTDKIINSALRLPRIQK